MSIYANCLGCKISENNCATLPAHSNLVVAAKQRKSVRFAGLYLLLI